MQKKSLEVAITLFSGSFDESGSNELKIKGARTLFVCNYGNGSPMPSAEVIIFGLSMTIMLQLMRIKWQDMNSLFNRIRVSTDGAVIYEGNITFAYIDAANAPDMSLKIKSTTAIKEAYQPATPISFEGEVSVVSAIQQITEGMGYRFENNGVPDTLNMIDATLVDTDLNKIRKLCKNYQIDLYIENKSICIAPQGSPRNKRIPLITPQNGLIGYPTPTVQGVDFKCIYRDDIIFGGIVKIDNSIMDVSNGEWRVFGITLNLEAELPNGNWFMDIRCTSKEGNNAAISK